MLLFRTRFGVGWTIGLLLSLALACVAQNLKKNTVLDSCANVFGTSIDTKLNLFQANSSFVLQPRFDGDDNLIALSVFPKYFLEDSHPEWREPEHWPLFSAVEYKEQLQHTEQLVAKGKLIASVSDPVITNSTQYFLDRYRHAYVRHGNVLTSVRFFDVYPFHEITGNVRMLKHEHSSFHGNLYWALVGELNYFVDRNQFGKLRRGRTQKLLVVGPVKGYCYGGFCNP